MKTKHYPNQFKNNRLFLNNVRRRWIEFRRDWNKGFYKRSIVSGCYYYPPEVYNWIMKFPEIDKLMKEYYKNQ